MYRKYHGFLHFFTSSSQSKPANNTVIYSVSTRPHTKKHDVLKQFSQFQLVLPHSKNDNFLVYFGHRSSGLKKQVAKLHLNFAFCLSVCHNLCLKVVAPKIGGGCLGLKMLQLDVLYARTMHFACQKKVALPRWMFLTCFF